MVLKAIMFSLGVPFSMRKLWSRVDAGNRMHADFPSCGLDIQSLEISPVP